MENYDYCRTMSDIDYEDSCNTECYDTDEQLQAYLDVIEENHKSIGDIYKEIKNKEIQEAKNEYL